MIPDAKSDVNRKAAAKIGGRQDIGFKRADPGVMEATRLW